METVDATAAAANDAARTAQAQGQAIFSDLNTRAKAGLEQGAKLFEEVNAFGKGNLDAVVESSRIAAKGVEALSQQAADFARRSFETATQAARTMATAKSPTEFLKLQGDYARSMFDTMIAESSRSTEAMLKLAGEVAQPISNRVALAAEKVRVAA